MVMKVRKGDACKTDPGSFIHLTITEYLVSHIQILKVITGKPENNYFLKVCAVKEMTIKMST